MRYLFFEIFFLKKFFFYRKRLERSSGSIFLHCTIFLHLFQILKKIFDCLQAKFSQFIHQTFQDITLEQTSFSLRNFFFLLLFFLSMFNKPESITIQKLWRNWIVELIISKNNGKVNQSVIKWNHNQTSHLKQQGSVCRMPRGFA